jgi:hypothetical protein
LPESKNSADENDDQDDDASVASPTKAEIHAAKIKMRMIGLLNREKNRPMELNFRFGLSSFLPYCTSLDCASVVVRRVRSEFSS